MTPPAGAAPHDPAPEPAARSGRRAPRGGAGRPGAGTTLLRGLRLGFGLLTVVPVARRTGPPAGPPTRREAGVAMATAVVPGLLLGVAAALARLLPGLIGPVAAVAVLAVGTRGLHLDGLADTADGLGSGRPAAQALEIMRRGDVGPFGVVTLVLVLLADVAGSAAGRPADVVLAVVTGRAVLAAACARGVPAARGSGLGALVAGSVPAVVAPLPVLLCAGVAAACVPGGLLAVVVAAAAAALLLRRCARRLGGVTGDVLGALVEVATAAVLLIAR